MAVYISMLLTVSPMIIVAEILSTGMTQSDLPQTIQLLKSHTFWCKREGPEVLEETKTNTACITEPSALSTSTNTSPRVCAYIYTHVYKHMYI